MSNLKDTYGSQWSDDPALLKKLLDAGNTILVNDPSSQGRTLRETNFRDGRYGDNLFRTNDWGSFIDYHIERGLEFLPPITPVEPVPLEWSYNEDRTEAYASHGDWRFYADSDGDWEVGLYGWNLTAGNTANLESAIQAIHEWRVNHLNSMIKK